jgi:ureidoglycolate lyase
MKHNSSHPNRIDVQPLTLDDFSPYGWMLGKTIRLDGTVPAFSSAEIDFWQEHVFDPGVGGETEVLWVNYRNRQREVCSLEAHKFSQQAIIPLTGEIIHVVAGSQQDRSPDTANMKAFWVPVGEGICMRPGCWHTTRVLAQEVKCLMLTRRSTTSDLIAHLTSGFPLSESAIATVDFTSVTS